MAKSFVIKGVNPATGRVVEIVIDAETMVDAKAKAEDAGLEMVTVSLDELRGSHSDPDPTPPWPPSDPGQ